MFHKLTEKHINPNPWEKMSVAVGAQTLSETVGMYCILIFSEVSF